MLYLRAKFGGDSPPYGGVKQKKLKFCVRVCVCVGVCLPINHAWP